MPRFSITFRCAQSASLTQNDQHLDVARLYLQQIGVFKQAYRISTQITFNTEKHNIKQKIIE